MAGAKMSSFSIVVLICSATLSRSDCQLETALDVVRGPRVDNPVMCGLNAQTMIARTDLVGDDGSQYMKVLCTRTKSAEEWTAEIEARKTTGIPSGPSLVDGRMHFAYFPDTRQAQKASWPNLTGKSHTIAAYVNQPGEGVLVAAGGVHGGYALFVRDGKPIYEYNLNGENRYRITSSEQLPLSDKSAIRIVFKCDGDVMKGGRVTMFLNDKNVAEGRVEMSGSPRSDLAETFDIGLDSGSPVSDQYVSPYKFTGVIDRVEVILETRD